MPRALFFFKLLICRNFAIRKQSNFRMPKPGFYAVRVGKVPGIYTSWPECEAQVKGFPNAAYKKFPSLNLAKNFLNEGVPVPKFQTDCQVQNLVKDDSFSPNTLDNIFSDTSFDDVVMPVITSLAEIPTFTPKISYPKSSKNSYYAVHRGKRPGIYKTWTECAAQIKDVRNASYRKFDNETDALGYVRTGGIVKANKRELNDLEINNRVVKRRKLNDGSSFHYTLENPDEPVVVFTDGASSENGRKRSRAGIGIYWGDNHPLNTSKRISGRQTNNRAEIYAAVHALNQAKQIGAKKVKLYTDSQFVIHAITDWIKKWKSNGWKLVTGKEVVNKEDFIALNAAQEGLDVDWIYVRAHARNKGNDEADRLAVAGSRLLLEPANCSEFQNTLITTDKEESLNNPFILTSSSVTSEKLLPLVLPDVNEKKPYYAVHRGKRPGVYSTWTECEEQIKTFLNPSFKKFFSAGEANEFVKSGKIAKKECGIPKFIDDKFVSVYTDGASSSNGKKGARAGIGVYWGPGNALNTSMRLPGRQTNNRAEIFAAVHALRQAKKLGINNVRLYTDSQFVIKGITSWIVTWKRNGWKLANGKPVINKEDFIALDNACQGLNIEWCYVKGHDDNPGNVEADQLAVAGCSKSLSETMMIA